MPLDAVLLDLDGTVLDSHGLILSSWRHVCETYDLSGDDEAFRVGIGRPLEDILAPFCRSPEEVVSVIAAYRAHNDIHHDAAIKAFPDMAEAILELRAAGVRVAIVTSKSRPFAERGLRIACIEVDALVVPKDVARPKPAADPVLHALELVGARAARAIMVGDAPSDLQAGRAAGVATGAALWGPFSREELAPFAPDHWLASPADLLQLALG